MKRFRWFQVEWPTSIRTLARRIKMRTFEGESGHGFFIDRVRDDYLEARYVERVEYTDVVIDPFGKELTFDRVEFRQTLFRASSAAPGLELIDPPRNVQALMNRLSEAVDFEVAITPAVVDVLTWSAVLQNVGGVSSVVDSLQSELWRSRQASSPRWSSRVIGTCVPPVLRSLKTGSLRWRKSNFDCRVLTEGR